MFIAILFDDIHEDTIHVGKYCDKNREQLQQQQQQKQKKNIL